MRTEIEWLNDALATKDTVREMTQYCVSNGEIAATDGRITAAHPWPYGGEFLVPGAELEKLLRRLPGDPVMKQTEKGLVVSSGQFRGLIKTQPIKEWRFPGVEDAKWQAIPKELPDILIALRSFISDNATQLWAMAVALENGWAYATNNVAIASMPCKIKNIQALLPAWAIDFLATRLDGLSHWCWANHYVGFKWENNAWMRSQLIDSKFPEKAAELARSAHNEKPTQEIDQEFKGAFDCMAGLTSGAIKLYANRIEAVFGQAHVLQITKCEIPKDSTHSIWGTQYLAPVIANATHWQPAMWPNPVPWKGKNIAGYVVGMRKA